MYWRTGTDCSMPDNCGTGKAEPIRKFSLNTCQSRHSCANFKKGARGR